MKPETKNWINLANESYDDCLWMFKGARYPGAIYHLGQALEKVLKAAQSEIANQAPQKIHNLVNLAKNSGLQLSEKRYKTLERFLTHYNRVRYRDISQAHYNTNAKVEPIINQGKEMYQWILSKLENH